MALLRKIRRKLYLRRPRRAFKRFETDEAQVNLIRYMGKIRAYRASKLDKKTAKKEYYTQLIFHSLFPQYSITPVAFISKRAYGTNGFGMVSEVLRNRGNDYKEYQKYYYGQTKEFTEAMGRHFEFVEKTAAPLAKKIFAKTGIRLNAHPVNVANVNGRPVFFEIIESATDFRVLWEFIRMKIKDPAQQKQLMEWAGKLAD